MVGNVRGMSSLVGAGVAGLLVWVSTQIGPGTTGGYWAVHGIVAGAGLTLALSQLLGGWTKRGLPRISVPVLLIGFLPMLVAAGWVLLAGQPEANWFQRHTTAWSSDIAIDGVVDDLRSVLGLLAFGLGLAFGFVFDTSGRAAMTEPSGAPSDRADDEAPAPPAEVPEQSGEPAPEPASETWTAERRPEEQRVG
jgi:hypothetical protein